MATYPAIDGVPAHASKKLLTSILRQELGFDGLVLSEGGGIGTLVYEGLAATQKEAGALALAAGVDVGISFESGYMLDLLESVRSGKVPMSLIDRSVRRILKQKFRLGLFEKADRRSGTRRPGRSSVRIISTSPSRPRERPSSCSRTRKAAPAQEVAAVDRRDRTQRG